MVGDFVTRADLLYLAQKKVKQLSWPGRTAISAVAVTPRRDEISGLVHGMRKKKHARKTKKKIGCPGGQQGL